MLAAALLSEASRSAPLPALNISDAPLLPDPDNISDAPLLPDQEPPVTAELRGENKDMGAGLPFCRRVTPPSGGCTR